MADRDNVQVSLRLASASRSDRGAVRAHNEDRVLDDHVNRLWAVADGMGGHKGGADAAQAVVSALAGMTTRKSGYGRLAMLRETLDAVNTSLVSRRKSASRSDLCGSTVVSLMLHDDHFACVWAGDSRAYLLRAGVLSQLTRDHSLIQELVDQGAVAETARMDHPQAHLITRAIGAHAELRLDQVFDKVSEGDVFLLCSDGLTACVSDAEIAENLQRPAQESADALLEMALAKTPRDNVSLVVVRLG